MDGLDEHEIVGCDVSHRCLLYHLMLFDQPDTVRSVKSTDLIGDRWTAMIREFWEVDEYREAAFNEYVQYCRPNAAASPFHHQVWGSQVSGYRHVRFLVSGPGMLAPQARSGLELGEEWSAAIAEYWCWRKASTEQKDGFVYMESQGYGRDPAMDDEGVPFPGSRHAAAWDTSSSSDEEAGPLAKGDNMLSLIHI